MPMPIWLAHRLAHRLSEVRKAGILPYLRPDGKTQVTIDYEDNVPKRLTTVLISTQHQPGLDAETLIKPDLIEHVITRSEEHTYELQSLMRISYAVFCLKKKTKNKTRHN